MAVYPKETFEIKDGRELNIRSCEPEDAQAFLDFHAVVASETTHTLQTPLKPHSLESSRERFQKMKEEEVDVQWGIFHEENGESRIVGMISLHSRRDHPWTKHLCSFGMMNRQEFWGQGLGKKMLEVLEAYAKKIGFTKIEAQVRVANDRGVNLYKNFGFEIEGTRKSGAIIDGKPCDEYYIAKFI